MILEKINNANDIKKIAPAQYGVLAEEIRKFIISNVSKTGGHLASSLGVVELTMALHLVLNLPEDKILWDVGHQAYTHKILTGRKNEFNTLRQLHGISGFPRICESEYDSFGMGHSSTSLSAGLGYVAARELSGGDNYVVSVIGDGALTGGMVYEAFNNLRNVKGNYIVVLNDNNMSISENVGGVSRLLTNLRTDEKYRDLKFNIKTKLSKIPVYGDNIIEGIQKTKSSIKQFIIPGMFFEDMGVTYIGPVDGHDVPKLVKLLNMAKRVDNPVLIHVHTQKGRGYAPAEKNPSLYHGIGPFDVVTGKQLSDDKPKERTYSDVFSAKICKLADENEKIVGITAAMPDGTGLAKFKKTYPNRFFDVGIAEEHAVTFAAGLAAAGYRPFVAIYSSFLQRGFDQVIHDVCIQNLPVTFIIDRAGIISGDGATHQGIFDLSYMGMIPGMTIMSPKNKYELVDMLDYASQSDGPITIRYPKGVAGNAYKDCRSAIEYGKSELLHMGRDYAFVAVGHTVELAMQVADRLKELGHDPTLVNARFIKPIDKIMLKKLSRRHKYIVTFEENVLSGGYGSNVLEYCNENNVPVKIINIALSDSFIEHGTADELRHLTGFDADSIYERLKEELKIAEE